MKYEIKGDNLPVVICYLEDGEQMATENGGMSWMSPNMEMQTSTNGGVGRAFGRLFSGEKMFQNIYTAHGPGYIAFSSDFPGRIVPFDVSNGNDIILQKRAFLASETSVRGEVFFNKKLGTGLFSGEGFIMQRYFGQGLVFAEMDGHIEEYNLAAEEKIVLETGLLAAMSPSCKMEVQMVKGAKNIIFGGEGLFLTTVTGPGKVYVHTMPLAKLAGNLGPYLTLYTSK